MKGSPDHGSGRTYLSYNKRNELCDRFRSRMFRALPTGGESWSVRNLPECDISAPLGSNLDELGLARGPA